MWLKEKRDKKRFVPYFDFGIIILMLTAVFLYRKIRKKKQNI